MIGNVSIPLAVDAGKFHGKLGQLNFVANDMPAEYGHYVTLVDPAPEYAQSPSQILSDDKAEQYYTSGVSNAMSGSASQATALAGASVATFTTTYASSLHYGLEKNNVRSTAQYLDLGYDNFMVKTSSDITRTHWTGIILVSNAIVQIDIQLPATATDAQAQTIVNNWLRHIDTYKKGTSADVQAENSSGFKLNTQ